LKGDEIVVSVQEERLVRKKRRKIYGAQRTMALDYCFEYAGIKPSDLSLVVLSATDSVTVPVHDLKLNPILQVELNQVRTLVMPHHLAHAASAFATSGFDESAVLVVDGIGSVVSDLLEEERRVVKGSLTDGWETISLYGASGVTLTPLEKHVTEGFDWLTVDGPEMGKFRSLGTIFSTASEQIFGQSLDAGKVMGLAPYGSPSIPTKDFFRIEDGRFLFQDKVPAMFRHRERWPLRQAEYCNLACSAQAALEDALLYLVNRLYEMCPGENLCYAGGVALNSVANERIIRETPFKNVYIIPAAEDSGPAIGAAYYGLWTLTGVNGRRKLLHDAMGKEYPQAGIARAVAETPGVEVVETEDFISETVELMCAGKNIGWFQGRSELGPRALGQRSIICDPRRENAKDEMNRKVKHREAFRPFAPVVLLEEASNWFEWGDTVCESPYMLRVAKFKDERAGIVPAVVHVDGTGRVQTVTKQANGNFYDLVKGFHEKTGVPIILNTSFNVMGMPIVETPEDALFCLLSTGLDYCVLGNMVVKKREDILLGGGEPDAPPAAAAERDSDEGVRLDEKETPHAHGGRADSPPCAPEFEKYLAAYQSAAGVIHIGHGREGLTATFQGLSSALEHRSDATFIVSGKIFNQCVLTFHEGAPGEVERMTVFVTAGIEWDGYVVPESGSSVFEKVVAKGRGHEPALQTYAGDYHAKGKLLHVALRQGARLIVTTAGQPDYELTPAGDHKFNLKNTPGYSIEFETDEAGGVRGGTVTQPNGIFILIKAA
jgi:carbamoyltransferase